MDNTKAVRLLAVSTELVQRYAPSAPQAVQNEAVIRCAGWLHQQPKGSVRSESVGPLSAAYATADKSALRSSGAAALLTVWKVRRAGAVG